jgi:hypothetical protein
VDEGGGFIEARVESVLRARDFTHQAHSLVRVRTPRRSVGTQDGNERVGVARSERARGGHASSNAACSPLTSKGCCCERPYSNIRMFALQFVGRIRLIHSLSTHQSRDTTHHEGGAEGGGRWQGFR